MLAAGLIDRLTLMTFPVVLGNGKRLFGDGTPSASLASCPSSTRGFSEISMIALSTASASATTPGGAKSRMRLMSPRSRCSSPCSAISSWSCT